VKSEPIAAILLAAGFSSRMGTLKALLPWEGRTLVRYQVEQLRAAGCAPVIVVTGYRHHEVAAALAGTDTVIAFNADFAHGRAGSLRAGAAAVPDGTAAILILNVDQPRSAPVLARLLAGFREQRPLLMVPSFEGRRGHPLLVDGTLRSELLEVSEADEGLKAVVRRHAAARTEMPFEDSQVLLDLNTPENFAVAAGSTVEEVQQRVQPDPG